MAFQKGCKPGPGRPKGSPNKASLPWKEFVTSLALDPEIQARLKAYCLERPDLMFKAAEFAFGKPNQSVDVTTKSGWLLPAGDVVAED